LKQEPSLCDEISDAPECKHSVCRLFLCLRRASQLSANAKYKTPRPAGRPRSILHSYESIKQMMPLNASIQGHHLFYGFADNCLVLEDSSYCQDLAVACVGNLDAGCGRTCVYDLTIADIESYMA